MGSREYECAARVGGQSPAYCLTLGLCNRPDDHQRVVLWVEILFGHAQDIVFGDLFDGS
jgi:hypothetical protein